MIYNKVKTIKMILATILTILMIISCMQSCSYAFTWEDFKDFLGETREIQPQNNLKTQIDYLLANEQAILTKLNVNINDYDSFILDNGNGSYYLSLIILQTTTTSQYYFNGNFIYYKNYNGYKIIYNQYNQNGSVTSATQGNSYTNKSYTTGLMTIQPNEDTFSNTWIYQNYYNYFDLLGAENRDTTLLPWYFANARIGKKYYNENISFKLYDVNDNFIKYLNADNMTSINGGYLWQLEIPNTTDLINGNYYHVKYNDNTQDFFTTQDFIISWQRQAGVGEITNNSGDVTGSINLKPIQDSIDNVNNTLQENQSFWEQAYRTMFVPSGDYVEARLEEFKNNLQVSGDYEEIKMFLEDIKNNSGDFIISWEDRETHFTIGGQDIGQQLQIERNQINFSQLERENEDLHNVMIWVRILTGFALSVLIIRQGWTLLLKTIGVSTDVYESTKDEQAIISKTYTKDEKGNTHITTTIKKGNEKWVSKK